MKNLLEETRKDIAASGHTDADIVFIGSEQSGYQCTWAEFCELANEEYDHTYGGQWVARDLIVVFRDGERLERRQIDGYEFWHHVEAFKAPTTTKRIRRLFASEFSSQTLAQLNESDEDNSEC